jgi:hypothetical protein
MLELEDTLTLCLPHPFSCRLHDRSKMHCRKSRRSSLHFVHSAALALAACRDKSSHRQKRTYTCHDAEAGVQIGTPFHPQFEENHSNPLDLDLGCPSREHPLEVCLRRRYIGLGIIRDEGCICKSHPGKFQLSKPRNRLCKPYSTYGFHCGIQQKL